MSSSTLLDLSNSYVYKVVVMLGLKTKPFPSTTTQKVNSPANSFEQSVAADGAFPFGQ